jgi:hypothetical protein
MIGHYVQRNVFRGRCPILLRAMTSRWADVPGRGQLGLDVADGGGAEREADGQGGPLHRGNHGLGGLDGITCLGVTGALGPNPGDPGPELPA